MKKLFTVLMVMAVVSMALVAVAATPPGEHTQVTDKANDYASVESDYDDAGETFHESFVRAHDRAYTFFRTAFTVCKAVVGAIHTVAVSLLKLMVRAAAVVVIMFAHWFVGVLFG